MIFDQSSNFVRSKSTSAPLWEGLHTVPFQKGEIREISSDGGCSNLFSYMIEALNKLNK